MCTKQCLISSLEMLREDAWKDSLKYRFDPLLGKTHEKYLVNLNVLIDHAKNEEERNESV
jgi:hypothetical protein